MIYNVSLDNLFVYMLPDKFKDSSFELSIIVLVIQDVTVVVNIGDVDVHTNVEVITEVEYPLIEVTTLINTNVHIIVFHYMTDNKYQVLACLTMMCL